MISSWFGDSLGKILVANGYFEQKSAKFGLFILKTDNADNVNHTELVVWFQIFKENH